MIAAVLHGPRDLRLQSRPALEPGVGEAVIQVQAAGLCGTDHRIWTGDRTVEYPRVMGHEFIGTVLAVGSGVDGLGLGEKVAVEPNYSCGACPLCREGNRNLCLSRTAVGIDVDGGFAEQVKVPARRTGRLEEIGPLVVYLASPASDFMTGQTVFLDGGHSAGS